MPIERAKVKKIGREFEIEAYIEIPFKNGLHAQQKQRLSFRGIDLPEPDSQKGRALLEYLIKVSKGVEFLAIKKYGRDSFLRFRTEFFYLPGEDDLKTVVAKGRSLNQELLKLGLAKPYDYKKRKIDFSKRRITVKNKAIDLVTGNFKAEVCMYINDCKQYLRSAIEGKPVNMEKGEFDPTDEEFLIIYGLKELKDMCMQVSGRQGLDWKGN